MGFSSSLKIKVPYKQRSSSIAGSATLPFFLRLCLAPFAGALIFFCGGWVLLLALVFFGAFAELAFTALEGLAE